MAQATVVALCREMTDVATVVQDRDSTVALDRVYDGKSGNNDLPMGVCGKKEDQGLANQLSDYVI